MTIYAIGTSHTYGDCESAINKEIDNPWPKILSQRLDCEVVNYGRMGVNNLQLIEMAEHICKNNKPDLIIAEMRWMPFPLLVEKHSVDQDYTDDLFSDTRHNSIKNDRYRSKYHGIQRSDLKLTHDGKFKLSTKSLSSQRVTDELLNDIIGFAKINFNHNVMHNQHLLQSLSNMHHLSAICKYYNVPVRVFVWAGITYEIVEEAKLNLNGLDTFDFFSSGKTFMNYAEEKRTNKWISKFDCGCGHWMEPVHEYFVDTIIDEVKQILT